MPTPPPTHTHTSEGLGLDNACVFFQLKRRVPWQDEWGTLSLLEVPESPETRQWLMAPVGLVLALNTGTSPARTLQHSWSESHAHSLSGLRISRSGFILGAGVSGPLSSGFITQTVVRAHGCAAPSLCPQGWLPGGLGGTLTLWGQHWPITLKTHPDRPSTPFPKQAYFLWARPKRSWAGLNHSEVPSGGPRHPA